MSPMHPRATLRVRMCFLSDIHRGYRGCRAECLVDFLADVEFETLCYIANYERAVAFEAPLCWPEQVRLPRDPIALRVGGQAA